MNDSTNIPLTNNTEVSKLLQILTNENLNAESKNFFALVQYMDTMEKQFNHVLNELQEVKQQLKDMPEQQKTLKAACQKAVQNLENKIHKMKGQLADIKAGIIEGSKKTVDQLKHSGLSGLNKIMDFMKIKDGLNTIHDNLNQSIASTEKTITKINAISREYHEAEKHIKNVGKALVGKEQIQEKKENGRLSAFLKKPFENDLKNLTKIKGTVENAIASIENLNQSVRDNQKAATAEKKPSILKSLQTFREKPPEKKAMAPAAEKPQKPENSL